MTNSQIYTTYQNSKPTTNSTCRCCGKTSKSFWDGVCQDCRKAIITHISSLVGK